MNEDIFFHIGLAKSASSTLQKFFGAHPELHFPDRFETWPYFVKKNPFHFSWQEAVGYVQLQKEISKKYNKTLIFSHERLSGNPHSGHYDAKEIAERIKHVCPTAKIILVIRNQRELVFSCYKQYIKIGGTKPIKEYIYPGYDGRIPLFDLSFYEYLPFINFYYELFGKENVLVLLCEELEQQPHKFYQNLGNFLSVSALQDFDVSTRENVLNFNNLHLERIKNFYTSDPNNSIKEYNPLHNQRWEFIVKGIHTLSGKLTNRNENYEVFLQEIGNNFIKTNQQLNELLQGRLQTFHDLYF